MVLLDGCWVIMACVQVMPGYIKLRTIKLLNVDFVESMTKLTLQLDGEDRETTCAHKNQLPAPQSASKWRERRPWIMDMAVPSARS